MADDFKTTVSRTLDTSNRQYTNVVWQAGKPPLDSELNLVGQIANHNLAKAFSSASQSGVLMNPRTAQRDFEFNSLWSNYLKVKPFQALINGHIIDVEETTVNLSPPPTQDSRVDFIFLEVWKTIISAQGSNGDLSNKPSDTTVYSNGNLQGAGLADELVDSNVGFETTKRVQVQYRFRVVDAIDIYSHLEGMSSNLVKAQGPLSAPSTIGFTNQYAQGDSGLWLADMSTVNSDLLSENVIYGIPICAVTRRNDNAYVAATTGGNANQNGAINRKPSATSSADATTLLQATLTNALDATTLGAVALTNGVGSGLDDPSLYGSERYLVLGEGLDREIIRVSGFATPNITIVARGEGGTQAKYHSAGSSVVLFNNRPDGKYADQVHQDDLFDMRHCTTLGEWDYQSLLESSLSDLLFGNLKTAYKQNQENNTTAGVTIEEVSVIDSQIINQTHAMDWPNGFRDTWSDASVPQMGLTLYLNVPRSVNSNGTTIVDLNDQNAPNWTIGPDLNPSAFVHSTKGIYAGAWIKLTLNDNQSNLAYGVNQAVGAERGVRFIAPREMRDMSTKRAPFTIEELGEKHGRLYHPTAESNYERPFIVFGASKYTATFTTVSAGTDVTTNFRYLYKPTGANFSSVAKDVQATASDLDKVIALRLGASGVDTPAQVNALEYLVTANGSDISGESSTLYCVLYGDHVNRHNNGVFKVIDILNDDVGTTNSVYYTNTNKAVWAPSVGGGSKVGFLILKPIDNLDRSPGLGDGKTLTIDFRTQEISDQDQEVMIAITESVDHDVANGTLGQLSIDFNSEFQLGVSVLYPSATGGIANVADNIHKIGLVPDVSTGEFLNNSKSVLHGANFSNLPLVENEIDLPTDNHVSLWNRLPSSNLPIGVALPTQMGGRIINEEADREAEAFTDENSKTVVLRPFQNKTIILNKATSANLTANNVTLPLVPTTWANGVSTDPANHMFLADKDAAFVLPEALMPRFGRQDIPLHTYTGTSDQFRSGLNHLFTDKPTSSSDAVFNIVGGLSNNGSPGVNNVLFVTGDADTTWGERKAIPSISGRTGIGAIKKSLSVPTSDFGSTLRGIELPPYYGVVRIYGVYERSLFETHLSSDQLGGHAIDRVTIAGNVSNGNCPNLLRTDTSKFTLYINQNGGQEWVNGVDGLSNTDYQNAHTYMLTEHAIDITRLNGKGAGWVEGSVFTDFDYVVEAVVFMFADGFISHNRYVLPREYNGSGSQLDDTSTQKIIADSVIPFAPPIGSHITIAYKRTPYQGDPLGTLNQIDQTIPQGRKSLAQLQLGTKTQPVDLTNTNRRNVEVLASMDFYTTLGTGKIGGEVYPTTITDVGHTPFPLNRNPSELLADGLTHISLRTSTFTSESDRPGGWASLFLFENAETVLSGQSVTLSLTKNSASVSSLTFSGVNYDTIEEQVASTMVWLQDLGYNCFQTRGEIRQGGSDNMTYFGVLIQAPNPLDTFEIEAQWENLRNGQDIQLFEGLRESPLSFEMFVGANNYEYKLNNRTLSRVAFSRVSITPLNAGSGNTPISLTGMTSRLPIGSLVRDSDFVCEDVLNNRSSYLFSSTGSFSTISNPVPVSPQGVPYSATLGISGDTLQMNDGKIYHGTNPASQAKFTISRGGGSVFGASGQIPGGPLSFLATSLSEALTPVLKGSALACRAMLVLNSYEEDDSSNPKSYGNELQLVVVTHAIDGNTPSITLGGDISPAGYGEGLAAADRFRIKGKPLAKINTQQSTIEVTPAPYNSRS